jgi:hypothetical protein
MLLVSGECEFVSFAATMNHDVDRITYDCSCSDELNRAVVSFAVFKIGLQFPT